LNRGKKGISETLSAVLLLLITLAGMAVVMGYYLETSSRSGSSLSAVLRNEGVNAGQILRVVYYMHANGTSYFFVMNVGNMRVVIRQCYEGTSAVNCVLATPPPDPQKIQPPVIVPERIYLLTVPGNATSLVLETTTENMIQLSGDS
jgi:hypothetical protein